MNAVILLKRLNSNLLNMLLGLISVVLFVAVVLVLLVPYGIIKLLACHTPIGRVWMPTALS